MTTNDIATAPEQRHSFKDVLLQDPQSANKTMLEDVIVSPDGYELQDNILDEALQHFHEQYEDPSITKDDVFFYCYGLLHNKTYRKKYANNLKKGLPYITMAKDFWAHCRAGKELTWLHAFYEELDGYENVEIQHPLDFDKDNPNHYRFTKMKFLDGEKTILWINDKITISKIPASCHDYLVSGKSPLEWLVDRYKIKTDKETGIENDPNDLFDEEGKNVVLLARQLIEVSMRTNEIVDSLPEDCDGR